MYKKIVAVTTILVAGSLSLAAQNAAFSRTLQKNVTRAVAQENAQFNTAAYENYKTHITRVQKPSYETLAPLLEGLTVYNKDFADTAKKAVHAQLAALLVAPVQSGWNDYRPIGMLELFNLYFPQENKDKAIATLEYNIKRNVVSQEQEGLVNIFKQINEPSVNRFRAAYSGFVSSIQRMEKYDPRDIIISFMPLIMAYDNMNDQVQGAASLVKKSLFKEPLKAGWGRTTTVDDLRYYLGKCEMAGGDYVYTYTPERLQEMYGLHPDVAEKFHRFVDNYTK